jgi:hypothetical protein
MPDITPTAISEARSRGDVSWSCFAGASVADSAVVDASLVVIWSSLAALIVACSGEPARVVCSRPYSGPHAAVPFDPPIALAGSCHTGGGSAADHDAADGRGPHSRPEIRLTRAEPASIYVLYDPARTVDLVPSVPDGLIGSLAMDDVKKAYREGEKTAKEAWRNRDGEDMADKMGNAGDDLRKELGNAGDAMRRPDKPGSGTPDDRSTGGPQDDPIEPDAERPL